MHTNRLVLREVVLEDAAFVLELLNSPGWLKYIGDRGVGSLDDARTYIEQHCISKYQLNQYGLLVMTLKETDQSVGLCGLLKRDYLDAPDLGFAILGKFEGRGYVFEASKRVVRYGFNDLGLEKIYAFTNQSNVRSRKLLTNIGFGYTEKKILGNSKTKSLLFILTLASLGANK